MSVQYCGELRWDRMKRRRLNCCNSNGYQDLHLTIPEYPECETEPSTLMYEVQYTANFQLLFFFKEKNTG